MRDADVDDVLTAVADIVRRPSAERSSGAIGTRPATHPFTVARVLTMRNRKWSRGGVESEDRQRATSASR